MVTAVTNRKLCRGDFLEQIEVLCRGGVDWIILREKDMTESEYEELAGKVLDICSKYDTECMLHHFVQAAKHLGCDRIHLSLPDARATDPEVRQSFRVLGISVHSAEKAVEAERLGAAYVTAGHVYETSCKPGLAPRGTKFLREVCGSVKIPVHAIGGITEQNMAETFACGAAGVCLMSAMMNMTEEEIANLNRR
ncbi:thiamine phosphate synthase [Hespellia stercorisuis]|uniref:Thiamine-phosphate pyrophosphorylase n=1 Tax=Hespellia stercorisuis DSM 15480 TaxID=1121950 RepID=A0A1M6QZU2_9FIRM|nr:thiamine phosphate synthase [Hespellia stercorisuis]SHK25587.1 thiamine-phosphate pyrophosphorylase [Hespellia stercorisuis DSM 15480]